MSEQGETWVWADGTIYDPTIPGYRQINHGDYAAAAGKRSEHD